MAEVPVPGLPELTRINSWPKFSPKISDNGTNLSLSIPVESSSFQDNGFFDRESSKGTHSTALTTTNTTELSESTNDKSIAAADVDSSLVSTCPFDASVSIIMSPEAQDDARELVASGAENADEDIFKGATFDAKEAVESTGRQNTIDTPIGAVPTSSIESVEDVPATNDVADTNLLKDLTWDNDGNAGEEEQPGIPQMQESDDLSSLGASYDGIDMAMSGDSDDSFTYMMRYCRCIESKSEGTDGEGDQVSKGLEGRINSNSTDENDPVTANEESFTPELSISGGEANKTCRGGETATKQKRPQPAFTSLDVLDIITTPQEEEETRTKKNDDKKSGKFTSFDVLSVLFGSCIGCGCGGGSGGSD